MQHVLRTIVGHDHILVGFKSNIIILEIIILF